jgi:hypothetical protein
MINKKIIKIIYINVRSRVKINPEFKIPEQEL